jgi:phospho-N-acetylmuramoyl-pentapeptide-transferase
MFYHLLVPLRETHIVFTVFRYITFRAVLAAAFAFAFTMLLMPLFLSWARKRGLGERISHEVPERHQTKAGTPTAGGLVFLTGYFLSTLLWARWDVPWTWLALLVPLYLGLLGFWDDWKKREGATKRGLSKRFKLFLQAALALAVYRFLLTVSPEGLIARTQFLFLKNVLLDMGPVYPVFIFFVLVGSVNAVNLTDGLDGLAGGVVLPPLAVMILVTYIAGHAVLAEYLHVLRIPFAGEAAVAGASMSGAVLGFLWFNIHPAEVFMGDTGSQALGGMLGTLALIARQEFLLAIAGGMLVLETLSVALQIFTFRMFGGRRVFRRAPLHHHFEELGWPETHVVLRFWFLSVIFSLLALSTLKIR